MFQLLQNLGDGRTTVVDVPAPGPRAGSLLIRTTRSLISAGTERMLVDFGRAGWIGKARQQPEKVRAVFDKIRANGLAATWQAVRAKLRQPIALGYCQVGVVADAGGAEWVSCGERVVSNGPHAEVVSIRHELCAKVPANVSDEAASFTPLGAIALQGIGLLGVAPGDKVVVTGLGLIGQLAVRILLVGGCEVLGIDPSPERRALAEKFGAKTATGDPVTAALNWTHGQGVAGVLITASTSSHEVVNQAARSCRRRGKVVLVGMVGLHLNRADFYRNEISFQVSCSYGTRDGSEVGSARANFNQVLTWMAQGRLVVDDLITSRHDFLEAASAYAQLADRQGLGLLMTYGRTARDLGPGADVMNRTMTVAGPTAGGRGPTVAVIGAGNFATRTLLPAMAKLPVPPAIWAVASAQGAPALLAAQAAGAKFATTDMTAVLGEAAVEAVFLTTRHEAHARQAIAALRAGKHVWVEKPLALANEDLDAIAAEASAARRVLMVGFNRRFAKMAVAVRKALASTPGPYQFTVTVNAGRLDPDHWTLDRRVGGGRIVGEVCHFVDLLRFLAGAPIGAVRCTRRDSDGQDGGAFVVDFADGSSGLIDYRTDLPAHVPKEVIDVAAPGGRVQIHNWARLTSRGLGGLSGGGFWNRAPQKGHPEAIAAFLAAVKGGPAPIPVAEILEVSRWCIAMQEMRVSTCNGANNGSV